MSTDTTRRRLLAGLATVPALAWLAPAAEAASTDPVIELARRAGEAEARWAEAALAEDRVLTLWRQHEPAPPKALYATVIDWSLGLGLGSRTYDGRRWHGHPENIEDLRRPRLRPDWSVGASGNEPFYTLDRQAQARADEIVAVYDEWQRQISAGKEAIGLTAAEQLASDLLDVTRALTAEPVTTPATTLAGLLAKAGFGRDLFYEGEEPFFDDKHDTASDRVAFSIVRDLLALQGRV